ncbi:MAG: PilZ domain-containing protein [Kineosporiaceae bacterium]|nr:PilZ domain-containing protein [Kineosporiaceae bacterium]
MAPLASRDLESTDESTQPIPQPAPGAGPETGAEIGPGAIPVPDLGAPAVIVPVDGLEPVAGEVTLWSPGGGIVVTSRVRVGVGAVGQLAGERVWVRLRTPQALVVLRAVAHPVAGRPDEIELTGVSGLAVESRRQAVRARLVRPILLVRDGVAARGTQTLDLSATGCRVRLPEDQVLEPGDRLQTVVTDSSGESLWLRSEVVRVDADRGEVALHFIEIADADRDRLDREVLSWHSRHH